MDQKFEYVRSVADPVEFIRANLEARPSDTRQLLREMNSRKVTGQIRDPTLLKELSPSAYVRALRRKKNFELDDSLSLVDETA